MAMGKDTGRDHGTVARIGNAQLLREVCLNTTAIKAFAARHVQHLLADIDRVDGQSWQVTRNQARACPDIHDLRRGAAQFLKQNRRDVAWIGIAHRLGISAVIAVGPIPVERHRVLGRLQRIGTFDRGFLGHRINPRIHPSVS